MVRHVHSTHAHIRIKTADGLENHHGRNRNLARRVHRGAARHVRRRETAHQGVAEDCEGRKLAGFARRVSKSHLEETQGHVERLEEVFASLDEKVRGKHCEGIAGIIEEGKSIMEEDFDEATMDACLIAAGQRAEHYEMAAYGTLVAWARAMGHDEAAELLRADARGREGGGPETDLAGPKRDQSRRSRGGASRGLGEGS